MIRRLLPHLLSLTFMAYSAGYAAAAAAAPVAVHVSPTGNDTADGSAAAPVLTLARAVSLASKLSEPCDIILAAGTYTAGANIIPGAGDSPWTVRPAANADGSFAQVIIDGSVIVRAAQAINAAHGVYFFPAQFEPRNEPSMWEAGTRLRYKLLADERSVREVPASFTPVAGKGIIFHTSDGRPPEALGISLAHERAGLVITRPNVTVRGLQFHSFIRERGSSAVTLDAANLTVEDCVAWNCDRMVGIGNNAVGAKVLRCTARDVATGVLCFGKETTIEDCRFFRTNDSFVVPEFEQNESGIQIYHPGEIGYIRRNLCVGFTLGIFIKSVESPCVIEYNTAIASPNEISETGIGCTKYFPTTVMRHNIAVGFGYGFVWGDGMKPENKVEHNLIWHASEPGRATSEIEKIRARTGSDNIAAAPRFVDPASGDYRLAHTSPAAKMGPDDKPIGALGLLAASAKDTVPPTLTVTPQSPARNYSGTVTTYTEKDHARAVDGPQLVDELPFDTTNPLWAVPDQKITLHLAAEDALSAVDQVQVRLGDKDWTPAQPWQDTLTLALPAQSEPVTVQVRVRDSAGNWSAPTQLRALSAARPPKLVGKPTLHANDHGVALLFQTDFPCFATLQWSAAGKPAQTAGPYVRIRHAYNTDLSKQWESQIRVPQTQHHFALTAPQVQAGQATHYRIVLTGADGAQATAFEGDFTPQGAPRVLHVAKTGQDQETGGPADHPFHTVQYAIDRALPGDRVVVAPGVYVEEIYIDHGGVDGAPLILESAEPHGAVLDAAGDILRVVTVRDTSHVQVKGFEIRWVRLLRGTGVFIYNAQHVSVNDCLMWNMHFTKARAQSTGVYANRSADVTIDHCVFFAMNEAFRITASDGFRITNNTANWFQHRVGSITFAGNGVLRNNSFTFAVNYCFNIHVSDEQFQTIDSDYNNLVQYVREQSRDELTPQELALKPIPGDFFEWQISKGLMTNGGSETTYHGLKNWQDFSGQEKHSIYAHPRYVDPANRDFRLQPDSPNIGKGENGATIGALGVMQK